MMIEFDQMKQRQMGDLKRIFLIILVMMCALVRHASCILANDFAKHGKLSAMHQTRLMNNL
jgi:hypothetical protein